MWRHCRHVGRQKQCIFSPLGNKIYFHAKLFHCFSPPWKPSIHTSCVDFLYISMSTHRCWDFFPLVLRLFLPFASVLSTRWISVSLLAVRLKGGTYAWESPRTSPPPLLSAESLCSFLSSCSFNFFSLTGRLLGLPFLVSALFWVLSRERFAVVLVAFDLDRDDRPPAILDQVTGSTVERTLFSDWSMLVLARKTGRPPPRALAMFWFLSYLFVWCYIWCFLFLRTPLLNGNGVLRKIIPLSSQNSSLYHCHARF